MIGSIAPGGPRGNLRLRLLLRFAEGPMEGAASPGSDARVRPTPEVTARLRLQLLNLPCLVLAGGGAHVLERKDAALLAMLAVEGPTPRNKAAALLWPDIDQERARNNLRQRLFRLRRLAAGDVVSAGNLLALAEGVRHDLEALGPRLANEPDAAIGELLGELDYGDCFELAEWVSVARDQWRHARCNALAEIAARLEADGRIAPALHYAQRLAADDPTLEHAHRRVMRLHYLRGDRAAALAAFERCRELLRQHVGAQPGKETLALARLIEASGALPRPAPVAKSVAILRPPRLVGREREWRALEQACDHLRVVVVAGEPGMGKTRLLSDFAAANGNALVVGGRPGDARVPYATLAALLRALARRHGAPADDWVNAELAHVLPELGDASAKFEPLRLRMAAAHAVEQWHEAGLRLLAVDDLHFADEATLEVLPALVLAADVHVVWLFGVRANELPATVRGWLAQQEAGTSAHIALGPLDEAAVRELIDSLALPGVEAARMAPLLVRHTGGNPLFMLETLGALLAQGVHAAPIGARLPAPASVSELIEHRLRELSPNALKLARVAALAGQEFSAELAAQVLGVHALDLSEPWRELETAQVLRDNAFAHDLILETAQRSVPAPIAQVMNRAIATFLEARGVPAVRIAPHWLDAQEWSRAGRAFTEAALDARRLSQRAREVDHWQHACECLERAGAHDAAFDARRESIESQILVCGVQRAAEAVDALMRTARTDAQRVAALTAQAQLRLMAADPVAGVAAAREAYGLTCDSDSWRSKFEAARLLAIGLAQQDRAAEALPLIEPFREVVERDGTREQRGKFWADYAYVLNSARRLRVAADALTQAIDNARALGDYAELSTLTSNLALVQGNLGRVDAALEQALRARTLRAQVGEAGGPQGAAIEMYVGMFNAMLGRYRDALASLEAALEIFTRDRQTLWIAVASNHKAGMLLDLGQPARARRALEYAAPAIESVRGRRCTIESRIERRLGHSGTGQIEEALSAIGAHGDAYLYMLAQLEQTLTLPAKDALDRCEEVRHRAAALEYEGVAMRARLLAARHRMRNADASGGAAELRQLLPRLDATRPADMYYPEAWWIAYEIFAANDEPASAMQALTRAYDWIQQAALPNVPDEYRDSFLNRNPVNRAIITTVGRRRC
jgi:DNA-binding SARP family transcriptional activator/tetratricopeptide (TPR) repeat protein